MRILLIEDDPIIGDAIRNRLGRAGDTIDWLTDAADLIDSLEREVFDLLLLDIGLPGKNGFQALKEIRAAGQDLPVLILTARYELDARVEGLDLGADDYLVKPFAMEELMARCRALVRRRSRRPEQRISYADLMIEPASHSVTRDGSEIQLTPKVFSLLMLFIENKGRVLTRRVLEDHLYGWDGEAESNTLEVFISQIRRKLGSDLIQTIRGVGYMLKRE